jgi:2-keto-4-pentenoate hydratase
MSSPATASLAADPRVRRGMEAQLAWRRERLAAGEQPLGWKVGFGTPQAMERFAIEAPLVGFLMRSGLVEPGRRVSLADWANPALEPEVAVHMASDLPAGSDLGAARSAIAGLGPAFELADIDPPPEDVERILAGDIFQRGVMLGTHVEGASPGELRGRVERRGSPPVEVEDPQATTGEIVAVVRHVADLLGAFEEHLRAGEVVITGAIVPPMPLSPGDAVEYELRPLGRLSIEFD